MKRRKAEDKKLKGSTKPQESIESPAVKSEQKKPRAQKTPVAKTVGRAAIGLLLLAGGIELYRSYYYQQQLLLTAQYELETVQKEAEDARKEAEDARQEAEKAKQERESALKSMEDAQKIAEDAQKAAENAKSEAASAAQTNSTEKNTPAAAAYLEGAANVNYTARVVSPDGIGVNLRQGPGSSYPKIRDKPVPAGEVLTISAEKTVQNGATWGYTQYDGLNGWVYLAELEPT